MSERCQRVCGLRSEVLNLRSLVKDLDARLVVLEDEGPDRLVSCTDCKGAGVLVGASALKAMVGAGQPNVTVVTTKQLTQHLDRLEMEAAALRDTAASIDRTLRTVRYALAAFRAEGACDGTGRKAL